MSPEAPYDQAERFHQLIKSTDWIKFLKTLHPDHADSAKVVIPAQPNGYLRGGMNVHLPVIFDNGVKWAIRIKQQGETNPSAEIRAIIMRSEIETMRVLKAAGVKVPAPLSHGQVNGGLEFFALEWIDGSPCDAPFTDDFTKLSDRSAKIIDQLAEFYVKLFELTFDKVGSLMPSKHGLKSEATVGALVSLDCKITTPPYFFGPFKSSVARYLAQIDHVLKGIEDGIMLQEDPINSYIIHLWLKNILQSAQEQLGHDHEIMLKHGDDKGDQIMVNDQGDLVSVIDWEFAHSASKSEAFSAPLALVEVAAFFNGDNSLSILETHFAEAFEKLGRADLAECVRTGMIWQSLPMVIGQEPDIVQVLAVEELLVGKSGQDSEDKGRGRDDLGAWCERVAKGYERNAGLEKVRAK